MYLVPWSLRSTLLWGSVLLVACGSKEHPPSAYSGESRPRALDLTPRFRPLGEKEPTNTLRVLFFLPAE